MLKINQQFERYSIISVLGAGGMGEVYLAEDKNLKRKVALKILSLKANNNEDYQQRFTREAQAISALNHPNIVTIYEVGNWKNISFIAMEFVEGDSLRSLIKNGELLLRNAVDIGVQTASALAAAHAAGIIHRDIKPDNIVRRPDGLVKVLDFGLAKKTLDLSEKGDVDPEAPTQTHQLTIPGMIMGTAAYMSPEQARGKETDERTDIWSLGVVIYEMITGHSPFLGETKSDMMAAILKSETPSLSIYTPGVPEELEEIIKKSLAKNREERYGNVQEMLEDLKDFQGELTTSLRPLKSNIASTGSFSKAGLTNITFNTENNPNKRRWLWIGVPVLGLLIGFSIWYLNRKPRLPDINPALFTSSQITSWKSDLGEYGSSRARFSPDGKLIAYVATKNEKSGIWLKQIGGGEPFTRKQEESKDRSPIWSPDGGSIAYISDRTDQRGIWMIPALGGSPTLLSTIQGFGELIQWSKDGASIYFEMKQNLYVLTLASRQITKLSDFDETKPVYRSFSISPDEQKIVYSDNKDNQRDLWTAGLHGENPVRLTDDEFEDNQPIWHPDGQRIIYNSNRNGVRQICLAYLDGQSNVQVTYNDSDSTISDISADGAKILYKSNKDEADLWGANISDKTEFQVTSDIGAEFWQDVAPHGESIVYQSAPFTSVRNRLINSLILVQKIKQDGQKITLSSNGFDPKWSPDGNQITFLQTAGDKINLWLTSALGGDAHQLTNDGVTFNGYTLLPFNFLQLQNYDWSPDSRSLIYCADRESISNVWQTTIDGTGERRLTNNEDQNLRFFSPLFSPDGSRLVWTSVVTDEQNKRHWSIWLSANGSFTRIYQADSALQIIGWSASEDELIVKSVESNNELQLLPVDTTILQISLKGGNPRLISDLKKVYFQNIKLSPDRKIIAFVTRQNDVDTIQMLPSTGGTAKTLISSNDARVYFSNLTFAPDGKTIYYAKQANWQIVSMIDNFK